MNAIKNLFYGAIAFCLECLVIMLLWNAVLPDLIGVSVINYWQTNNGNQNHLQSTDFNNQIIRLRR